MSHPAPRTANEFAALAALLLPICTDLRYLECTSVPFGKSLTTAVGSYPPLLSLRELSVGHVYFRDLIPVLIRAPSLEKLDITSLTNFCRYPDNHANPIDYAPLSNWVALAHPVTPTFSLHHLHLCSTRLHPDQIPWLLAYSRNVALIELEGYTGDILGALATSTGSAVRSLKLTGRHRLEDPVDFAQHISLFTGLKALQLSRQDVAMHALLPAIRSPLESLGVYYSAITIANATVALCDRTCLPGLKTVAVYCDATFQRLIEAQRRPLEDVCSARDVECIWETFATPIARIVCAYPDD
ncbi:hypothetical protein BKA93DRAFT_828316 [Sparassis latifolia]